MPYALNTSPFQTSGVNDIRLFDRQTVALTLTSTGLVVWTALIAFGAFCFTIITTTAAVWTLTTLNNLNTHLSQKTRIIQRKLTISLIIQVIAISHFLTPSVLQTVLYNLLFLGISSSILILVMSGYGYTGNPVFDQFSLIIIFSRHQCPLLDVFVSIYTSFRFVGGHKWQI